MSSHFDLHAVKNNLKRRWIIQLANEFDSICYQYRLVLSKPIFLVEDLKSTWGNWDPYRKSITISADLILHYPWYVVLNVLKHEMAHLIVHEEFRLADEHGAAFLRACQMLGLEKQYCSASLKIEHELKLGKQAMPESEEGALFRKVEKLLSLASSANEHEALLAMEKVQEIYEKYNLKKIKEGERDDCHSLLIHFKKKRLPLTYSLASCILQEHFFVHVIFSDVYDPFDDCSYKALEIMGRNQNVLMAEYVFHFLLQNVHSLWSDYQQQKKLSVRYKLSYQHGVLEGFLNQLNVLKKARMRNEKQEWIDSSQMLICLDDPVLEAYVRKKYPRTSTRSGSRRVFNEHFSEGKADGKRIHLNKPIHTHSSEKKLLS